MFLELHKDVTLLLDDVVRVPNDVYDRLAVFTKDGDGDYLWLISPLRRDKGVLQSVPGMLLPVWAATYKGAVSTVMLAQRGLLTDGPGELRAVMVQQILRWDERDDKPTPSEYYAGAVA